MKSGPSPGPWSLTKLLLTALLIEATNARLNMNSIRGVDVFEANDFKGVGAVSMAGGGQVLIREEGHLHVTPSINRVRFSTADLSPSESSS